MNNSKWKKPIEEMPDMGEKVIVYLGKIDNILMALLELNKEGNEVFMCFCTDGKKEHYEEVTHWRKLPKKP
jgi:hypothetical protein